MKTSTLPRTDSLHLSATDGSAGSLVMDLGSIGIPTTPQTFAVRVDGNFMAGAGPRIASEQIVITGSSSTVRLCGGGCGTVRRVVMIIHDSNPHGGTI